MFRKLAVLSIAVAASLFGQSGNSTISGVIKDASGAPLVGANVSVVNADTAVRVQAPTNSDGIYRASALLPGTYRVEIEATGFDRSIRGPLTLEVGQSLAVDVTLQVGSQSQTVDIVEQAPLTETQSSSITQTVTRQMLDGLPLPNRAASSLASLSPGVVMIDTGTGTAENYPVFSVAGGRARNQNFVLDGGNVTNATGLTRPMQMTSLPVDAMQEFRVISNNYAAEYGHSAGGVIVMSTRSGTNQLHGTVFESLQNDVLNARNFFAAKKPPIRLNQFGGSVGGPIIKNKTFFFATWERTRQLTSDTILSTVPTELNRAGNFSDLRSGSGTPITIYDPSTKKPFEGNIIPQSRFDSVALAALSYYPQANRPGTSTNANNFIGNTRSTLDRDIIVARGDHQFRASDLVSVRYYINNSGTQNTGSWGNSIADPDANMTDVRVQSLLGAYTHIFTPTIVNDFRYTYLRRKFLDRRFGLGENLASSIGLTGVTDQAFPAFTVNGYTGLSNSAVARIQTPIQDNQFLESLSWAKGKHFFRFGFEYRFAGNDEIRDRGSSGNLTLTPLITSNNGAANTGNALASLLLGEVNTGAVQISDKLRTRASYLAGYLQDDWRVTDRLTLNYGLRWETELPRKEVDNKLNSFDPLAINPVSGTPGVVTFAGIDGTPERAFRTDKNNFGPRLGLAYKLNDSGRTVIRAGAGMFYASTVSNTIGDTAALGFSTAANFTSASPATQSAFLLDQGFPPYTRPGLTPALGAVPVGKKTTTAVSYFNPAQVAPISYQYNADLQHEVMKDLVIEVGYTGNVSHHLTANDFSLNQLAPQFMGSGDKQSLRPFPQFSNVTWINPSIGNSTYHGGFIRAQKRFSSGLSFLAHYTRSKFIDDVEASTEYGVTQSYMDAYNRGLDKGLSASDVPNRLILSILYEVPSFSSNRYVKAVAGGWKVGILQTIQSGAPFTVITTTNNTNAFSAGPLRPNIAFDPTLSSEDRSLSRWFDTTAFAQPKNATFGNSPRSGLRGDSIQTTDVTMEKKFRFTERWGFEVRAEFYNLLNQANFNIPGFTFGASNFGVVSSARAGRTAQLGARLSF